MRQQGRCTIPADDAGRVLDRLAGIEKVIPPEQVRQSLLATGKVNGRACLLTHEIALWLVLAMGLLTELPIRQVFKHARRLRGLKNYSPGRSALCQARQRLGVEPIRHLFQQVVRPLACPEQTPDAFYQGLRRMGIDGVILDVPDSQENHDRFGRPSAGVERGEGAFPQVRKVSLVELGTHAEIAFAWQGTRGDGGEIDLVEQLVPSIPPNSLLYLDSGFFSYTLWQQLAKHVQVLMRISSTLVLQPIRTLSDGSYLAKIYPSSYDRTKDRNGILVRVIRYTIDDPQRVGHGQEHRLITTLLDERVHPAVVLIAEYHERWEHELVNDEQKTHQDPRRASKPTHLRSQTPEGIEQELYALVLGHFVVRALMTEAAAQAGVDPDRLSFTGCFQILKCRLPECEARTPQTFQDWYQALLAEMAQEKIPPRRNRINPRVIKRKMSKWKKKRAQHRAQKPLTKTFAETIVVIT
jgi:Insertion element 4 transposase N-terminal/Transposase DDE domain